MGKSVRRGYVPTDEKEFKGESLNKLYKASEDLLYLLNRDYKLKGASIIAHVIWRVNHYFRSNRRL